MNATYTQKDRMLQLETPLGVDKLLLSGFSGTEELSRLFCFRLEMISPVENIAFNDIVGKKVTFSIGRPDGGRRYFCGHVSRFSNHGKGDFLNSYSCEVVPWLWFLTKSSNCRVFQDKSVATIIAEVFDKLGFSDYEINVSTFRTLDYCVQYRETDFNFVTRLMEEEGIFYYFRHENGKHVMVIGDGKGSYADCDEKEIQFLSSSGKQEIHDNVTAWEHTQEFVSGKVIQRDFNYEDPGSTLETSTPTKLSLPGIKKYEVYDYPGEYAKEGHGAKLSDMRMQEQEAMHDVVQGSGVVRSFAPGLKFGVKHHRSRGEQGKSYVLMSVQHQANVGAAYLGAAGAPGDTTYRNSFAAIPDSVTFRPRRSAYKPTIHGAQTAFVVGPAGKEIHTDKLGRVKVQFHWDREGKKDDNSSCWIRVAQFWAGNKWGALFIPRIGHEVVVQFLEGDIDRPLIVGSVYNEESQQPYTDNPTWSGIKTESSTGGGGSNELRFEDKKGSEDIYFHAQKDFHRVVENNDDLKVHNDQTITIDNSRTTKVDKGNDTLDVEQGDRITRVRTGNDWLKIKSGDHHTDLATGSEYLKVEKGNRDVQIEMGNDTLTIKMGNQTTKLDLGKSETEAMQSIEFKVGQSSIKIDQMGVTIKGMMVTVDGEMMTQVKGMMTQIDASAMLMAKGGLTMIG